jgi:N-acetylneuraminic acid mutarotase
MDAVRGLVIIRGEVMKKSGSKMGLGIVVGLVLLMSMFSLRVIPTPAAAAITAQWTAASPLNDTHSQAVVVQDDSGLVYVIGGVNAAAYNEINNVSSYDPTTGQWNDLAPLPHAVRGSAGVYFDGKIYVFGGTDSIVGYTAYTQIYDIATDSWSSGTPVPSGVWEGKAGVSDTGQVYLFGGERPGSSYSTAVNIYDIATDSWSLGTSMSVGVKAGAVVSMGYYFLYIGGVTSTGTTSAVNLYYTWGSWNTEASLPQATAALAAVKGADGLIYAFGGGVGDANVGSGFNATYYYNSWDDSWTVGPNMTVQSRYLGGATTADGLILALGGNDGSTMLSTVNSMRIMSVSSSVSPTTVAAGKTVIVTVSVEFANTVPQYYYGEAVLVSGSGTSYSATSFEGTFDMVFAFQMSIPDTISAGAYTIDMQNIDIQYSNGDTRLPEQTLSIAVVVGATLDEQMQSLRNEITTLQEQLNQSLAIQGQSQQNVTALVNQITVLLGALSGLQAQVDRLETKANNAATYGMVNIVLVIIILVLLALMFVMSRRKP